MQSRRDFLKTGLAAMAAIALPINTQAGEIQEEQLQQSEETQSKQYQQSNNHSSYQDLVKRISEKDKIEYRLPGKIGKESIFVSIYKYPDRALFKLSRKQSTGFFKSINYSIRLSDYLDTGWGNLDRATLTFKDGSDRSKKESSEATIELSEFPKSDELVQKMQKVYEIAGKCYVTKKNIVFNEDINVIDRLFSKIFDEYRILPPPMMNEYGIPSPADFQSKNNQTTKKEQDSYDGRSVIYEVIKTGAKIGIPRK